jgi:hypothetical protein
LSRGGLAQAKHKTNESKKNEEPKSFNRSTPIIHGESFPQLKLLHVVIELLTILAFSSLGI